ncbi:hypothetical protein EYC80_000266 [Monilinia laxa]|uniref:Uncharacterized protein n=1 Tax=Monilinia laxa TaxID=61186 RepID=A0A5N6KA20_MONLA|nr:hypothetical protein EYC80_000266 [Monilinia laxa]
MPCWVVNLYFLLTLWIYIYSILSTNNRVFTTDKFQGTNGERNERTIDRICFFFFFLALLYSPLLCLPHVTHLPTYETKALILGV